MQRNSIVKIIAVLLISISISLKSYSQLSESFSDISTLPASGWVQQNNSQPLGSTAWMQGAVGSPFLPYSAPGFIAANFKNTSGTGTISNWLITPIVPVQNGAKIVFRTRSASINFPERLQVRVSTNGNSSNVGTTSTSVGDFTTLILDINPGYGNLYPDTWTYYEQTISGIPAAAMGRVAFRYFVENGGPGGENSNYIGIDNFIYVPVGCGQPTGFTVNPTATTASFSWDETGTNVLEYGPAGFTPGTGLTAGVGGTAVTAIVSPLATGGFLPSTNYTAYLRKNCGAGVFSLNTLATNFTTRIINDECNGAVNLTPVAGIFTNPGLQSFNNTTLSAVPVSCGVLPGTPKDIWYKFTTDNDGIPNETLVLSVVPRAGTDVAIAAYTGVCGGVLTEAGCSNTGTASATEILTLNNVGDNVTYYLRVNNVDGIGLNFTINITGSVLPLTLLNFNGHINNGNAVLDWQTTNEINTLSFTIERSTDGKAYNTVGNVTANNTSGDNFYSYTDNNIDNLNSAEVYYRLKQNDRDGNSNYSKVVVLKLNSNMAFQVYPNPVADKLNIVVNSPKRQSVQIIIIDNKGSLLQQNERQLVTGSNVFSLPVTQLATGAYLIKITGENINEHLVFIKK